MSGFPCGSVVVNPPAMQEMWVWSLGQEDPLEMETMTHSRILAWKIHRRGTWQATVQRVANSWTQLSSILSLILYTHPHDPRLLYGRNFAPVPRPLLLLFCKLLTVFFGWRCQLDVGPQANSRCIFQSLLLSTSQVLWNSNILIDSRSGGNI